MEVAGARWGREEEVISKEGEQEGEEGDWEGREATKGVGKLCLAPPILALPANFFLLLFCSLRLLLIRIYFVTNLSNIT